MPRTAALLTGATLLLVAPLTAQSGLTSAPVAVTLTATRLPSVSVMVPARAWDSVSIPVATRWNLDPAEPVALTLVAFFDPPMLALAGAVQGIRPGEVLGRRPVDEGGRSGRFLLFTQPIFPASARSGRTDVVEVRIGTGTLNLMALTQ
ncbi:MAG TPA: hypothetical protein VFG66_10290 [Gemmatimonadales bacterium]|nr:hypothetical protein [Gemmatimonadales bacterium]